MIGDENEDEPQRGDTSVRVLGVVVGLCLLCCIYPLGHLLAWVSAAPPELNLLTSKVYPGFHIGLCPHFTLGYAGVSPLQGSLHAFSVSPGFHIGLCPHFTLGYAGVSPLQGSLSYWLVCVWAFVVLCSLNVFGCVNGLLHLFVFLYGLWYRRGDCLVRLGNEPQRGDTPA